jgi:hypothetical protein
MMRVTTFSSSRVVLADARRRYGALHVNIHEKNAVINAKHRLGPHFAHQERRTPALGFGALTLH